MWQELGEGWGMKPGGDRQGDGVKFTEKLTGLKLQSPQLPRCPRHWQGPCNELMWSQLL